MKKISVIIPVYNTREDYLRECINSIIKQEYTNIEIIIVDDGSKEVTAKVCDEIKIMDERILVFHTKNAGVSSARNYGIIHAIGDFICFVDSDDWLEQNILSQWIENVENQDVIISNVFIDNKEVKCNKNISSVTEENRKEMVDCLLTANSNEYMYLDAVWGKLYKRNFLIENKILFTLGIPRGEDTLFNFEVLYKVGNIALFDGYTYHYRTNDESVTHQVDNKIVEKYNILIEQLKEKAIQLHMENFEDIYYEFVVRCFSNACRSYIFNHNNKISRKERKRLFTNIINNEPYNTAIQKIKVNRFNFKKKIRILIMKSKCFGLLNTLYN